MSYKPSKAEKRWRKLITDFEVNSLTVDAFCRQNGVSTASLYNWRKRFRSEPTNSNDASFIQLPPPSKANQFRTEPSMSAEFTLITHQGTRLHWTGTPPVTYIQSLMEVLP